MLDGVRDLHDARYCAAIGIGLLGFPMEGEGGMAAAAIKEIVDWLSGPASVGIFGFSPAAHIAELAAQAALAKIQVSADYPIDEAAALQLPLIFHLSESTSADRLATLAGRFPDALFIAAYEKAEQMEALQQLNLIPRSILTCAAPDAVWQILQQNGLQAYGFLLGAFTEDAEGQLDYDVCDEFIAQYDDLVPA